MLDTGEFGACTNEVQSSPGTVSVSLVNHFQERRIKTGASANMENLYDQGNGKPVKSEEMSLHCSVQSKGD